MPTQHLKIPLERVGVLIGREGSVKSYIESKTSCRIHVNSDEGEVFVECDDALSVFRVAEVVKAIGRGFSPEKALKLLDDDELIFDIISLSNLSERALKRIKGRIIGKNGKTRRLIEELTGAYVSVYGKTVSLIGYINQVRIAREAIEMLINGVQHGTVYSFMERKRKEMEWEALQGIIIERREENAEEEGGVKTEADETEEKNTEEKQR